MSALSAREWAPAVPVAGQRLPPPVPANRPRPPRATGADSGSFLRPPPRPNGARASGLRGIGLYCGGLAPTPGSRILLVECLQFRPLRAFGIFLSANAPICLAQ